MPWEEDDESVRLISAREALCAVCGHSRITYTYEHTHEPIGTRHEWVYSECPCDGRWEKNGGG